MKRFSILLPCLAMAMIPLSAGTAFGQQQQEQQGVQVQQRAQVLIQDWNDLNHLNGVQAFMPEVQFVNSGVGISPEDNKSLHDTLDRLYEALSPDAGDNMLAEVWSVNDGSITILKGGLTATKDELRFDPSGDLSLKQFIEAKISRNVVKRWKSEQLYGIGSTEGDVIRVQVGVQIPSTQVTFKKKEHGYQIVSVVFVGIGC